LVFGFFQLVERVAGVDAARVEHVQVIPVPAEQASRMSSVELEATFITCDSRPTMPSAVPRARTAEISGSSIAGSLADPDATVTLSSSWEPWS